MKALIINCSPVRDGATAEIVRMAEEALGTRYDVKSICIDDYRFGFCRGCRACHTAAKCVLDDDVPRILEAFDDADLILCVSPSYWADIPGQFKAFIDRCTPWSNTHDPHLSIAGGKKGYAIVLRTGPNMKECARVIESIEHFYGHLEIRPCGSMGLTSVENRAAALARKDEILAFCTKI